jgi:hypothetical protein
MANIKNLNDYLKNDSEVKSAKSKLDKASADLARETIAKNAVKEGSPSYADVMARYNKALDDSNTAKSNFNAVSRKATEYFNANKESILAETKASEAKTDQDRLTEAQATKDRLKAAGQSTTVLDKKIEDLQNKIAGTGKYTPKEPTVPTQDMGGAGTIGATGSVGNVPIEDFLKNLDAAGPSRINEIKTYLGISNLDGKLDYATIIAIYAKEKEIETVADATGKPVDRLTYYKSGPKPGGEGAVPTATISSPTSASAIINSVFQSELGRDATSSEIAKYTTELNTAERKNPSKTVKGITTGGLNKTEFLTQIVKKLPEYSTNKSDKLVDAKAKLTATALANGFNINSDFSDDLPIWLDAIDKGQKIDKFQQSIRNAARRLLPEGIRNQIDPDEDLSTTFSTYRSNWARALGVPVNTVSLAKIIPMATTDKGFATNREFEINKRKDPLWDSSEEGIASAYEAVNKIKATWGF